jgi:hypothetical protein
VKKLDDREPSVVLTHRDYGDVAHLQNPTVGEKILSGSRSEAVAYVEKFLGSGISNYGYLPANFQY